MATYRFDLSEEYAKQLENNAKENCMSVQDYIRSVLFPENSIFTVKEILRRIQDQEPKGEFTIPDLFEDSEWKCINHSLAGVLGKNFFRFVQQNPNLGIKFVEGRTRKRRALYTYEGNSK